MDEKYNAEWYANRIVETEAGRLVVSTFLVNKYRTITGSVEHNTIIRNNIINECRRADVGI